MFGAMKVFGLLTLCGVLLSSTAVAQTAAPAVGEELQRALSIEGQPGGQVVVALRAEPKTLNPVVAADNPSKTVIWRMMADLVHINRASQKTEPALAKSWSVSHDNLHYTLKLRRGLKFSDGQPADAEDVLFSFRVYMDEAIHAPQRDLLTTGGKPITVRKVDAQTVVFDMSKPYGAAERLFDGFAILPRHLLEQPYRDGKLLQAWPVSVDPKTYAGLGPFRLREYFPGERIVLEKNPYYWKDDSNGTRLPYLDRITFVFVPSDDAQVLRFQNGDTDLVDRLSAEDFSTLQRGRAPGKYVLSDAGPSLEYNFLFFNLNDLSAKAFPAISAKQKYFRQAAFRQAVSLAIDREAIVRLVYQGKGVPLWNQLAATNKLWEDPDLPKPPRSLANAKQLLRDSEFSWNSSGDLLDAEHHKVAFTIITSSSSGARVKMATLLQDDLKQLGIDVQVVTLEFRAVLDRVLNTHDYEACLMGLASGDADPNADLNVWLSDGPTHLWDIGEPKAATPWEAEIDKLMNQQMVTPSLAERRKLYYHVQELIAQYRPLIFLASPDVLVGAKANLGNFQPAVMDDHILWNAEDLYWRKN